MRNWNIELMRCMMMIIIIVHHCCIFCSFKSPLMGAVSAMAVFAVNGFVFISGWYGVRFSMAKIIRLLGLGLFAVLCVGVASGLSGDGWDFRFSLGWFGNAYVALLCLSPIVNAGIDHLRGLGNSALVKAWGAYAAVMVLSWFPIGEFSVSGWFGHSFNTILFVYVSGRVLSGCDWVKRVGTYSLIGSFCVLELANLQRRGLGQGIMSLSSSERVIMILRLSCLWPWLCFFCFFVFP